MLGLLEKGDPDRLVVDPLAPVAIPTTLSGYLMARLDQVGSAREIAGYAAVIGREFSLDLLANVSGLPPERLRTDLGMLLKAELINRPKFPAQKPTNSGTL